MRWMLTRRPEPWPTWLDDQVHGAGTSVTPSVTFVNHSTVLIRLGGMSLVTDPVWSMRVGPFPWLGAARVRMPGVSFEALPQIDAVLLSHDHYDHLDVPTVQRLAWRDGPRLLCGLGVDRTLEIDGLHGAEALDWWEERSLGDGVSVTFLPSRHFSGRGLKDQDATLWGSFLVRGHGVSIYFAGDTGYGRHFQEIRDRFGPVDCALLPIGCYEPRWFMRAYHMSPADAVQAHLDLGAKVSVGIHHGTFRLGDESIDRPAKDLAIALEARGVAPDAFRVLDFGATLPLGEGLGQASLLAGAIGRPHGIDAGALLRTEAVHASVVRVVHEIGDGI